MNELDRNLDDVGDLIDQLTDALTDAENEAEFIRSQAEGAEWMHLSQASIALASAQSNLDDVRQEVREAISNLDYLR